MVHQRENRSEFDHLDQPWVLWMAHQRENRSEFDWLKQPSGYRVAYLPRVKMRAFRKGGRSRLSPCNIQDSQSRWSGSNSQQGPDTLDSRNKVRPLQAAE